LSRDKGGGISHPIETVDRDRDFATWVAWRLADWPTSRILELELWLLDEGETDFLPAVRDVLWKRTSDPRLTAA
jgi:hypothetical protein